MDMNNPQEHEYVDLGLPSGTLWATCNVGASKPEDYGDYFAWGETKKKDVYDWNTYKHAKGAIDKLTKYCNKSDRGYNGFADTLTKLQPVDDPATANWGNDWYTPKKEQWDELYEHTNSEWTTRNGVEGWLFTSRRNGNSLFLPAAGSRWDGELYDAGGNGYYWSSSLRSDYPYDAWYFGFLSDAYYMGYRNRGCGQSVRAVRSAQLDMNNSQEHEYVDLGLPSGTLWATCNVGASKPEDYGDYFAWGEIQPKTKSVWDTYKYSKTKKRLFKDKELITKYCNRTKYGYDGFTDGLTELQASDDAAAANWGNGWYTPKKKQWDELMANTNSEWTTRNGVKGRLFTSWKNGKSLFLPAAGGRWYDEIGGAGSYGYFWSSSLYTDTPDRAWYYGFGSVDTSMGSGARYSGISVRAVRSAQLDMNCCPEHEHVDLGLPSGTLWATCNVGANKPEDNCCPEHEYVDLGLPSGTLWATCNVGANKPKDYGDYFAWGETKTKSVYDFYTYKHAIGYYVLTKYCNKSDCGSNGFTDTLIELQPCDDPATANWGNGWYTPKKEQWDELMAHTNREGTKMNGVVGWLFTSRRNGKRLFLPAAGRRVDSYLNGAGSGGDYWSSSLYSDDPSYAWYFDFGSGNCYMGISNRGYGRSVRAVRSARQN